MNSEYWSLLSEFSKESFNKKENKILSLLDNEFYELMINSSKDVYIEDRNGMRRFENYFVSDDEYFDEISTFLSICNQRISVDKPIVNFDYNKKFRINIIHSSVSGDFVLTIRKSASNSFDESFFLNSGFIKEEELDFVKNIVRKKKTIFISGGTSTGKTTFLKFLFKYFNNDERIVIIEDTKEIVAPIGYNCIYLRTQVGELNIKDVSTSDLLKTTLRLRPDRIILGEIRRDEVVEFLHAINTGHQGSISTGHGNSCYDMISRLEILLIESGIPYDAAKRYLGRGIDYIIQLSDKKNRSVSNISEVSYKNGMVVLKDVFYIVDAIIFHIMLIILANNLYISFIIIISLLFFILKIRKSSENMEVNCLGELSMFKNALESGENPISAYNKIFKFNYPKYFVHPRSSKFSYKIFLRQYNLYEKKILLEQELQSNFTIIKFRMTLMKYVPIILMYILSSFINENGSDVIKAILIIAFISSYYYSDRIAK